jgi:uncharacterized protein YjiS (DUF1127 family)
MASQPITYQADLDSPATRGLMATIGEELPVLAAAHRARELWHEARAAERLALQHVEAAIRPRSISAWLVELAMWVARVVRAELRIRRNTRELMGMSDSMLKDIGLSRADVDRAVRYGRGW